MDFGKVTLEELKEIDFSLPAEHKQTMEVLSGKKKKTKVYIGAAKWGRPDWVRVLYPKGTKASDFLSHYVKHFNSIELNATFHQPHAAETIKKWTDIADDNFRFSPKVYQGISHWSRLKNAENETDNFIERISNFGKKLGPVFLQLKDDFSSKNFETLQQYVANWNKEIPMFVELRNAEWFSNSVISEEVFSMLQHYGTGMLMTDTSGRRDVLHMRLQIPVAFIRFVGNNLHATDFTRIDEWVERIKLWMDKGLQEVYFFLHNHDEAKTPLLVKYTVEKFNAVCGLKIQPPQLINNEEKLL